MSDYKLDQIIGLLKLILIRMGENPANMREKIFKAEQEFSKYSNSQCDYDAIRRANQAEQEVFGNRQPYQCPVKTVTNTD